MYQVAKGMNSSYDALVDLLESIECLLWRLDIYTEIPHSTTMDEIVVKIISELLSILAQVTKELKQGQWSEFFLVDALPTYLNAIQQNLRRNVLQKRTSRQCYGGWTDSLKMRLR
jgi:hypothetical protein